MIEQAIRMLEGMIKRYQAALEELKATYPQLLPEGRGAEALKKKIEYMEKAIANYEEQLKRLKEQANSIRPTADGEKKKEEPQE